MKKLISLILVTSFVLISCDEQQKVEQEPQEPLELSKDNENYHQRVTEYTYQDCEYIKVGFGKSIWGSHKGNCKNPIHVNGR